MNQGKIVPTQITCGLIKNKMDESGRVKNLLISI
jgi:adenylate kinase family enzyme